MPPASALFYALSATILIVYLQPVTTLQCYSCAMSVKANDRCVNLSYSGNALPYYTCLYGDAVCAKYVIEYGDSIMMHRGCQHSDVCTVLAARYNNQQSRLLDCQSCSDHDYCNSGKRVKFVPIVLIFLSLIVNLMQY